MPAVLKYLMSAIALLLAAHASHGQADISNPQPPNELIKSLQSGGHIIYMRHGKTTRKNKSLNKNLIDLERCETQRNLTPDGLLEVKSIGHTIAALGIPIGKVLSSPYCRTKDTAKAVFGAFEVDENLAFSIAKEADESAKLGQYLHGLMLETQGRAKNAVFVGHTANLKDGLGVWPKPEGVAVIFKAKDNKVIYKGMIKPDEWPNL